MIEPENVTAPMITSSRVGTVVDTGTLPAFTSRM